MRHFWDRPAEMWTTVNAYLFDVQFTGRELEFQIHPEFGSREAARAEVDTYAPLLGRIPAVLLSRAKEVEISASNNVWQGNGSYGIFHIYTGQGREYIRDGFVEEVFLHEGGHLSLDLAHVNSAGWRAAQEADGVFISDYAAIFGRRRHRREHPAVLRCALPAGAADRGRPVCDLGRHPESSGLLRRAGIQHVALSCEGIDDARPRSEPVPAATDLAAV